MSRAEKSGINAEVQQKASTQQYVPWFTISPPQLAASYPLDDEAKTRAWMEAIVGESIGQDFWDGLKDGSYLCRCAARPPLT